MLSKLELFTDACAKLDKRGIVVNEKRCLHKRHLCSSCQRCSSVCPNGAITYSEALVFIADKCTGCGACSSVCPSGALSAKLPSNQELHSLVALHVEHSGAVAFACETYLIAHPVERRRVIPVQCTARCDESILVHAVLRARGTGQIQPQKTRPSRTVSPAITTNEISADGRIFRPANTVSK